MVALLLLAVVEAAQMLALFYRELAEMAAVVLAAINTTALLAQQVTRLQHPQAKVVPAGEAQQTILPAQLPLPVVVGALLLLGALAAILVRLHIFMAQALAALAALERRQVLAAHR